MSTTMQFENPEFGKIRVLEIDGEIWFFGIDVTAALGYKNGYRDVVRHVDEEDRKTISREEFQKYRNGSFEISNRGLTVVNESGFYSLVMGSKLPRAKEFKRWITSEVLPSIRKTGSYSMPNNAIAESFDAVKIGNIITEACKFAMRMHRDLGINKYRASVIAIQLAEEKYGVDLSFLLKTPERRTPPIDINLLPF